jgi:uncharacterized flavoprotein (TIGR03862 family)
MKTSPLLRAWLAELGRLGVRFEVRHRWTGGDDDGRLLFETPDGARTIDASCTVLNLGVASWPHLGADGSWVAALTQAGVRMTPLVASNSAACVAWSDVVRSRFAGSPLKRIALTLGPETVRGEAVITTAGLEGGAVYALSAPLRQALAANIPAVLLLDLRPDESTDALAGRLAKPHGKQSLATFLRKAVALDPPAIGLLQEATHASRTPLASSGADALARLIKSVPIPVTAMAPLDRAISSAGGVSFDGLDERFMLRARPGAFVAGEMLDWDAPTGGYLLQACFATGRAAAEGALAYLAHHARG